MVTDDEGLPFRHHAVNGTYDTALQLTGFDVAQAEFYNLDFAKAARATPSYQRINPAMRDYYETGHYIFTHGWVPCIKGRSGFHYIS